MNKLKFKPDAIDIAFVVLSLAFLLGILFVFSPCSPKEDGSWMTCHWAGVAVTGLSFVLLVLALIHLFVGVDQIKIGLALAVIPIIVLNCLLPGTMIQMCMMRNMRCHAVMTPAVIIFSALLGIAAVIDVVVRSRRGKK